MREQEIKTTLASFQKEAFKAYKTLGFNVDNANTIFGIIIGMRNLVLAAEAQDTILLHKFMGACAEHLSNYATVNSIKISEAIHKGIIEEEIEASVNDLEHYLEQIKNDMSFVKDMKDSEKIEFIQKCWVSIFPEEYSIDFIKIERILKSTIEDNKIKFPQLYFNNSKYGME